MGKPNRTQSGAVPQRPRETLGMGLAGRQPPLPNKTQTVVQTTRATSPSTSRPYARKTIVILTDGYVTEGRSPVSAAQDAAQQDVVVHTVTFSVNADQSAMRAVAAAGSGRHYHAPDAEALEQIFREIALTMLVVLTE